MYLNVNNKFVLDGNKNDRSRTVYADRQKFSGKILKEQNLLLIWFSVLTTRLCPFPFACMQEFRISAHLTINRGEIEEASKYNYM